MSEKPILFSAPMVRAILEGRKTQTRRVVKFNGPKFFRGATEQVQEHFALKSVYPVPKGGFVFWSGEPGKEFSDAAYENSDEGMHCPYGQVGDRLWVRETWRAEELDEFGEDGIRYRADDHFQIIQNTREAAEAWGDAHRPGNPWRPSIYMPRWASRITLEIVNIRVERVQTISADDALAEGIEYEISPFTGRSYPPKQAYQRLWDSINAKRGFGWDVNPWVWVLELKYLPE